MKLNLDKLNIPYTIIRRPSQVDVAKCFHRESSGGKVSESLLTQSHDADGDLLLDFIFQVAHFRQVVPAVKQQELLGSLRRACTFMARDAEMLVDCDTEYVVVVKKE